jgi:hypothetical protein
MNRFYAVRDRVYLVADTFDKFPRVIRFYIWRGLFVLFICITGSWVLCLNIVMAQDSGVQPTTLYEVQESARQKSTDKDVDAVKQKLADIEIERQQRHTESMAWKAQFDSYLRESRERQSRDEGMGMGAFFLIGALQSIGLVSKYESAKKKIEASSDSEPR